MKEDQFKLEVSIVFAIKILRRILVIVVSRGCKSTSNSEFQAEAEVD